MSYRIAFFNEAVEAEVMEWPGGILASFTRIAERITEHGPNLGMPYTRAMGDLISNDVQPTESPAEAAAHRWRQPRAVACEGRADRIGG